MDMTMSSATPSRLEVVTSVQRRRRWTPEQKLEIVKQTNEPGSSVSMVARQFGITAAQLFQWRKAYLQGSLMAVGANETVMPASELQEAMRRIKQLEGALGRKTLENEILKEALDFALLLFVFIRQAIRNAAHDPDPQKKFLRFAKLWACGLDPATTWFCSNNRWSR